MLPWTAGCWGGSGAGPAAPANWVGPGAASAAPGGAAAWFLFSGCSGFSGCCGATAARPPPDDALPVERLQPVSTRPVQTSNAATRREREIEGVMRVGRCATVPGSGRLATVTSRLRGGWDTGGDDAVDQVFPRVCAGRRRRGPGHRPWYLL